MSADEILEHNLTRLFRVAWRPVTPNARFAAGLRARLEAEVARSAEASAPRRSPARTTLPARASAARRVRLAAAFLALLAGLAAAWFLVRASNRAASADPLVAAGCVAVQDDADASSWRAATERELAHGIEVGARAARVVTPPDREVTLHLGSAGRVEVAPRTRVGVGAAGADGAREIALDGESARVRRDDAGEPWRLVTPGGIVALARGIVSWSHSVDGPGGSTNLVELAAGIAWIASGERAELSVGQRTWLRDGRVVVVSAGPSPSAAPSARTSAAFATEPGPGAAEPAASEPRRNLTGAIVLSPDAAAPASVRVTLLRRVRLPEVSQPETTEFRGTLAFAYEDLRAGTYDVFVEAEGFAVARRNGVEVAADRAAELRIELAPSRSVRGRVLDAATGAPIADAAVLAETLVPSQVVPFDVDVEGSGWRAATRARTDGSFVLDGLGPDGDVLRVTAPGYAAAWSPAPAASGEERAADGASVELAPVRLARGGSVEGRVLRQDGSAWPGAFVIASRMGTGAVGERMSYARVQSDSDGAYSIADLPPGAYVVFSFVPSAGGTPATRDLRIAGTEVVHLDLGPTERRTRLVGTVRDASGAALADMDVMVGYEQPGAPRDSSWIAARTDAEGRFAFEGVDPRRYEIFVGRGLGTSFAVVNEIDVPLAPEVRHDVRLPAGSIRGRVFAIDGTPAAGAYLVIMRTLGRESRFVGRAQADSAGAFEVLGLAPGTYGVFAHAAAPGVAAVRAPGVEVALESRAVELRFAPGVELVVRVLDGSGRALADRAVRFTDEAGVEWQFSVDGVTDAQGTIAVPGLAPGRWRIAVDGAEAQTVDLELGPRREVEFRTTAR